MDIRYIVFEFSPPPPNQTKKLDVIAAFQKCVSKHQLKFQYLGRTVLEVLCTHCAPKWFIWTQWLSFVQGGNSADVGGKILLSG